ncbi:DUF4097 family beta strand repeat-containing protein [Rhodothermus marinus]|uniref:DUF4097 family beta strand repeat-containing protein n=1 Tax=Rhodothermus marinus TaxID=29549 RepID=UPI0012BA4100|nr:DUF4097 family beta strand repeat-containing protein [Rhodothermus marinus]BBM68823.1 hypothetical protein RmaAA213_06690 [Rhodothermus marinus]
MHKAHSLGIQAALLVLLLGLGACRQSPGVGQTEAGTLLPGAVEAADTLQRGVLLAGRTLVLEGLSGRVSLQGADVDVARLTFVRAGRGADVAAARRTLREIQLREEGTAGSFRYRMEARQAALAQVHVAGTVPRDARLVITRAGGDVRLEGIEGPIRVQLAAGEVHVREAADSLEIRLQNGSASVHFRRLPTDAVVTVQTENGDLWLTLPPATDAQLQAETAAGEVRVEGLIFTERSLQPREAAGARFVGKLGQGRARVTLRTAHGDIVLRSGGPNGMIQPDTLLRPLPPDTALQGPGVP